MSIRISEAMTRDIPELVELIHQLFVLETDFQIDQKNQINGLNMLLNRNDRCVIIKASTDEKLIGMVTGQLVISTSAGGFSILIEDMIVLPDYRDQGVGHSLLLRLEEWGKNHSASRAQLVADRRNTPAQIFYEKMGFSKSAMEGWYKKL